MILTQTIKLLTGIALFLFGMTLMGDGLKRLSGDRLEPVLFRLSSTPLRGVILGTGVTAVIQSSCATSVMVVGFVNSGMMKLRQSIGVILGAILGTSITGWVLCLSYLDSASGIGALLSTSTLTGIVAVIGIYFRMFRKTKFHRNLGDIMMGFAILMIGMEQMSSSVRVFGEQPWFTDTLTSMTLPALGILAGTAFTALLQSASAAVGIIQALSVTGSITFGSALPLLMGVAIGASFPVLLSAIGANTEGKRAASVYLIASVVGSLAFASVFYILETLFMFSFMDMTMNPFSLAMLNTVLRLGMVALLAPFMDILEALTISVVPEAKGSEENLSLRLEERFINHPALAITQSRIMIHEMAKLAQESLETAFGLLTDWSEEGFQKVESLENTVDKYEDALGSYLVRLTGRVLSDQQNHEVSRFLHTLSDFERISDHALNIAQSASEIRQKGIRFSDSAVHELDVSASAVKEVVNLTVTAFINDDPVLAGRVEPLEEVIDNLCDDLKMLHIERLQNGQCTIIQGFVFTDLITDMERTSDHCSNIAVAIIELDSGVYDTHEYLGELKDQQTPEYMEYLKEYAEQYSL